jgi:hypothetical protein
VKRRITNYCSVKSKKLKIDALRAEAGELRAETERLEAEAE